MSIKINVKRAMTIVTGGGINVKQAVVDALMDDWKSLDRLGLDDDGIIGHLPQNAKYLRFTK